MGLPERRTAFFGVGRGAGVCMYVDVCEMYGEIWMGVCMRCCSGQQDAHACLKILNLENDPRPFRVAKHLHPPSNATSHTHTTLTDTHRPHTHTYTRAYPMRLS